MAEMIDDGTTGFLVGDSTRPSHGRVSLPSSIAVDPGRRPCDGSTCSTMVDSYVAVYRSVLAEAR